MLGQRARAEVTDREVAACLAEVADHHQARVLVEGEDRRWTTTAGLRVTRLPHQPGGAQHPEALDDGRARDPQLLGEFVTGDRLPRADQGEDGSW